MDGRKKKSNPGIQCITGNEVMKFIYYILFIFLISFLSCFYISFLKKNYYLTFLIQSDKDFHCRVYHNNSRFFRNYEIMKVYSNKDPIEHRICLPLSFSDVIKVKNFTNSASVKIGKKFVISDSEFNIKEFLYEKDTELSFTGNKSLNAIQNNSNTFNLDNIKELDCLTLTLQRKLKINFLDFLDLSFFKNITFLFFVIFWVIPQCLQI